VWPVKILQTSASIAEGRLAWLLSILRPSESIAERLLEWPLVTPSASSLSWPMVTLRVSASSATRLLVSLKTCRSCGQGWLWLLVTLEGSESRFQSAPRPGRSACEPLSWLVEYFYCGLRPGEASLEQIAMAAALCFSRSLRGMRLAHIVTVAAVYFSRILHMMRLARIVMAATLYFSTILLAALPACYGK